MNELNNYKNESNFCPFKNECIYPCNVCTDETISLEISELAKYLMPFVGNVIDAIVPLVNESTTLLTDFWRATLELYPNKRVVFLALHHPQEKVRKKNINRIMRWYNKN